MIQLNKKGLSPKPDVGGGGTLQGLFASNRLGMAIGGGFWAGGLTNAGMKKAASTSSSSRWQSQRHLFGAGGYAIFKSSQKKDLAWETLKLLVKPETFDIVFPGNVTTPGRKSLMTAERYAKTGPKNWSVFYDTLTEHPERCLSLRRPTTTRWPPPSISAPPRRCPPVTPRLPSTGCRATWRRRRADVGRHRRCHRHRQGGGAPHGGDNIPLSKGKGASAL